MTTKAPIDMRSRRVKEPVVLLDEAGAKSEALRNLGILTAAIVGIGLLLMWGRAVDGPSQAGASAGTRDDAFTACVLKGEKYFKDIGSFPKLSDGRDALAVAWERCSRTTTAFP